MLRAVWSDEPTSFLWVEEGRLAGSGYPASRNQVLWLKQKGIRSILTLTEDGLPAEWLEGTDVFSKHVPMVDHQPPSQESLSQSVDFITEETAAGRPVLVHCLAGKGRTMCVTGCYLIKARGMTAGDALRTLRRLRPGAVESAQESSLFQYASALGRKD
jgi:atypical dual specificity phosphatase